MTEGVKMINFFRNLSGESWYYARNGWWYWAYYFPKFGVGLNIHPNRFRQAWRELGL